MWFAVAQLLACSFAPEPVVAAPGPGAPIEAPAGKRSDVTVDALADAIGSGAPIIDVRTPEEFASGHVPGAINLPLGTFGPDDPALAGFDKGEPLFVICQSGGRSSRAADALAAGGFQAVNVKGGTSAWLAAGRPVQR